MFLQEHFQYIIVCTNGDKSCVCSDLAYLLFNRQRHADKHPRSLDFPREDNFGGAGFRSETS